MGISPLQIIVEAIAQVVADAVVAVVLLGGTALVIRRRRHRRVQRLFGVTRLASDTVKIRLSRIEVWPKGTTGTVPITEGFHGAAVTEEEYHSALQLAGIIQSPPLVGLLQAITDRLELKVFGLPTVCDIRASDPYPRLPIDQSVSLTQGSKLATDVARTLAQGPYVLIGSPVYNVLTRYVLEQSGPYNYFEFLPTGRRGFRVLRFRRTSTGKWQPKDFERRRDDEADEGEEAAYLDYLVVQKVPAKQHGSVVFVCHGTSTTATSVSTALLSRYLTGDTEWAHLERQFGGDHFACLYEVPVRAWEAPYQRLGEPFRMWPPGGGWSIKDEG